MNDDVSPIFSEAEGDGAAEALRGSGDQSDATGETLRLFHCAKYHNEILFAVKRIIGNARRISTSRPSIARA
ncbi:MAG: hypothetical protein PVS2B2_24480 [Candidatus Acidiferrum sp.]